jgi:hypothetical protein
MTRLFSIALNPVPLYMATWGQLCPRDHQRHRSSKLPRSKLSCIYSDMSIYSSRETLASKKEESVNVDSQEPESAKQPKGTLSMWVYHIRPVYTRTTLVFQKTILRCSDLWAKYLGDSPFWGDGFKRSEHSYGKYVSCHLFSFWVCLWEYMSRTPLDTRGHTCIWHLWRCYR